MNGSTVHLTVPAASAYAVVARTAAASVAAGIGATVEGVEDLRIIVSEAFALALDAVPADHDPLKDPGIDIALTADGDSIAVDVSAPADSTSTVDEGSFAWTILDALVDDLTHHLDTSAASPRLHVSGRTRLHVPV